MAQMQWSYNPTCEDENCIAERKAFRELQQSIAIDAMFTKHKQIATIMRVYRTGTNEIGVLILTMDEKR